MPHIKNVSTAGALDLPLIGRVVEAGEVFEVTPDQLAALKDQPDVWSVVTPKEGK